MNPEEFSVVYLAAGMSSRFGGRIKQFARVGPNRETLIEYSVNQAIAAGFKRIVFIVGEMAFEPFKNKFGFSYKGIPVFYAKQVFDKSVRDKPWGTCDALVSARNVLTDKFVICNGDDIYGTRAYKLLLEHLKKEQDEAIVAYPLIQTLPERGSVSRGLIKKENDFLLDIDERLGLEKSNLPGDVDNNSLASMNLFGLHLKTVYLLEESLKIFKERYKNERKKECFLPVEISNLVRQGKIKVEVYLSKERWLGITNPEDEYSVKETLSNQQNL